MNRGSHKVVVSEVHNASGFLLGMYFVQKSLYIYFTTRLSQDETSSLRSPCPSIRQVVSSWNSDYNVDDGPAHWDHALEMIITKYMTLVSCGSMVEFDWVKEMQWHPASNTSCILRGFLGSTFLM